MARTSRYSAAERAAAVERAFADDTDASASSVAAEVGVSVATLYRWASAPAADPAISTVDRLLDACLLSLQTSRFDELTVQDVAARAEVSARTAFNHFPTKEVLFRSAIDRMGERISGALVERTAAMINAAALEGPLDPERQLTIVLVAGFEAAHATAEAIVLFRDLGVPPSDDRADRWHEAFTLLCASVLAAPAGRERLLPEYTPRSAAVVVTAANRALIAQSLAPGRSTAERDACRAANRRLAALVLRGVATDA